VHGGVGEHVLMACGVAPEQRARDHADRVPCDTDTSFPG
jgi:hypothetical protein